MLAGTKSHYVLHCLYATTIIGLVKDCYKVFWNAWIFSNCVHGLVETEIWLTRTKERNDASPTAFSTRLRAKQRSETRKIVNTQNTGIHRRGDVFSPFPMLFRVLEDWRIEVNRGGQKKYFFFYHLLSHTYPRLSHFGLLKRLSVNHVRFYASLGLEYSRFQKYPLCVR